MKNKRWGEKIKKVYKLGKIERESRIMHRIFKIISIIIYIILIPILIFNFTLIVKAIINPKEMPDFFGYKNYIIVSKSMEPTIKKEDVIFIKKVAENELKENDIISFSTKTDEITTHRIIKIEEKNGIKYYTTKGDNNKSADKEKVTYSQVEGKYQFKISGLGVIIEILKNKLTIVILLITLLLIYIYTTRLKIRKKKRKQKRMEYKQRRIDSNNSELDWLISLILFLKKCDINNKWKFKH